MIILHLLLILRLLWLFLIQCNPQTFFRYFWILIFKRENTILDTLESVTGVCPCFTFFSGNGSQTSFLNLCSFGKFDFIFGLIFTII